MEIILREDVPDLGIIGEIVHVKPGYARNFLFPRGIAVPANRRNLSQLEHEQSVIEVKKQRERGTHERMAEQLAKLSLETEVRAGRGGKLFGSVTKKDIHALLTAAGFEIDRRRIDLREPLREIGVHPVPVRVGQDVVAEVSVNVKPLGGELEDAAPDELPGAKKAEATPPEASEVSEAAEGGGQETESADALGDQAAETPEEGEPEKTEAGTDD